MKRLTVAITIVGLALGMASANADTYSADVEHATVGFRVSHLVISKVRGHFNEFDATLEMDENNKLANAEITIQVGSIDTGMAKRDKHLKGADFFDAENHATMTFKSSEVKDDVIVGELTIRGVTRKMELPYTVRGPITDPWGNTKLGFEAAITINRTDYGVAWNSKTETGDFVVGEDVELEVNMEFAKQ